MNVRAQIHPVFVDRKTAAELLMISVDTFDTWLRAGFIPAAQIERGQIVRWHWPTLEDRLAGMGTEKHHDPSVEGVRNAQKGRRHAAA
jgi:hypothetical protein